jgi:hypothetical protein
MRKDAGVASYSLLAAINTSSMRSLALLDLLQEALTFFLRVFDQSGRRIECDGSLLSHLSSPG